MKSKLFIVGVFVILIMAVIADAQIYMKRDLTKIQEGMTTDEVKNILGRPHEINTKTRSGTEIQQWIYVERRGEYLFLYFENGIYTGDNSRYGERRRSP